MPVSFSADIRPLFTEEDIEQMMFWCDLGSYDDCKTYAEDILGRLNGSTGAVMPPETSGGPWPADKIALFAQWMKDGCPP
jgi:hypothetical protein